MLYLAEVQKTNRLLGGAKAELKLLAKQQSEYQWVAVTGEEAIAATEMAHSLQDRALVLVELTADRQIQTIQNAARQLVGILQQFSRLREKAQSQISEIEGWKESLRIQSQELNRRELELISYQEEIERLQAAIASLEREQQTLDIRYQDTQRLLAEAEQQGQSAAGVDPPALQQSLQSLLTMVETQQATLARHWQVLDSEQQLAQEQQSLKDQQGNLERLRQRLNSQVEQADWLRSQQQFLDALDQQLAEMAAAEEDLDPELQELLDLPLEALEAKSLELQESLLSLSRFVQEQDEELSLQRQTVAQLQAQVDQASEAGLADTLAFEQQRYQMLSETLIGQRRSLRERQLQLKTYQTLLQHRQDPSQPRPLAGALQPILESLAAQRQYLDQQQQQLAADMAQLQDQMATLEAALTEQASREPELQQGQQSDQQWASIQSRRQLLQPLQEALDQLSQALETLRAGVR